MKTKEEFIDENDCEFVSTTIGTNGYPKDVKTAIVSNSFKELEELKEKAEKEGFECELISLHNKDGWGLYNRCGAVSNNSYLKDYNDSDWVIEIDTNEDEDKQFEQAAQLFYHCKEDFVDLLKDLSDFNSVIKFVEDFKEKTQDIVDEANVCDGVVVLFYDMDNKSVDYVVGDDSTGYSYDSHNYKIALTLES